MKNDSRELRNNWPEVETPERTKWAFQIKLVTQLMRRELKDQLPCALTSDVILTFLNLWELVARFEQIIFEDSVFRPYKDQVLPSYLPVSFFLEDLKQIEQFQAQVISEVPPGIDDMLRDINPILIDRIDEQLILDLDEMCDVFFHRVELERHFQTQFELSDDAIRRAKVFLELDQEDKALKEFQRIPPEVFNNPENAVDLVDLVAYFRDKKSAMQLFKYWLIFKSAFHPLVFGIMQDLFLSGKNRYASQIIYLYRDKLLKSRDRKQSDFRSEFSIGNVADSYVTVDIESIFRRLEYVGIKPQRFVEFYGQYEGVFAYSLLLMIVEQLPRLAAYALSDDDPYLALKVLERLIVGSVILINLPPDDQDIQNFLEYGSYTVLLDWVVENLKTAFDVWENVQPRSTKEKHLFRIVEKEFRAVQLMIHRLLDNGSQEQHT